MADTGPFRPRAANGRRVLLRQFAALPFIAAAGRSYAQQSVSTPSSSDAPMILVAGPAGGRLDRWSNLLAPVLGRYLPSDAPIRCRLSGGADGVTAANQFEARIAPDGQTALLLPGEAALAWLAGDPRTHFDAGDWVSVLTGQRRAAVFSRVPAGALRRGARLRVAASTPVAPDLAALLGIDLLGVEAVPLFDLSSRRAAIAAYDARTVDALLLTADDFADQNGLPVLADGAPLFSLGVQDDSGAIARDPALPDAPTLPELIQARGESPPNALLAAWRAVAAAAQLDFGLVLPQLAPATQISAWRHAAAQAIGSPEIQSATAGLARIAAAPGSALPTAGTDAAAMLELRRWLAGRFNWQPS